MKKFYGNAETVVMSTKTKKLQKSAQLANTPKLIMSYGVVLIRKSKIFFENLTKIMSHSQTAGGGIKILDA